MQLLLIILIKIIIYLNYVLAFGNLKKEKQNYKIFNVNILSSGGGNVRGMPCAKFF